MRIGALALVGILVSGCLEGGNQTTDDAQIADIGGSDVDVQPDVEVDAAIEADAADDAAIETDAVIEADAGIDVDAAPDLGVEPAAARRSNSVPTSLRR